MASHLTKLCGFGKHAFCTTALNRSSFLGGFVFSSNRQILLKSAFCPDRRCFASSSSTTQQPQPLDESLDRKRARLIYQSRKRGILENDILLGRFSENLHKLNERQLREYDAIVNGGHNEWDVYYWLTGAKPVPSELDTETMKMLQKFTATAGSVNYKRETFRFSDLLSPKPKHPTPN